MCALKHSSFIRCALLLQSLVDDDVAKISRAKDKGESKGETEKLYNEILGWYGYIPCHTSASVCLHVSHMHDEGFEICKQQPDIRLGRFKRASMPPTKGNFNRKC